MKTPIWAVMSMITAAVLAAAFGQMNPNPTNSVPSCAKVQRSGRRIVSNLEIMEFYLPRFAHVSKVRDADYVEYYVRYGPKEEKLWLKFMFGGLVGGYSPDDLGNASLKWTSQKWGCDGHDDGTDRHGISADGRRWRHVSMVSV